MSFPTDPEGWLESRLAELLGFSGTGEIARYVLSFDDYQDQLNYMKEMLDPDNESHRNFLLEFERKRPKGSRPILSPTKEKMDQKPDMADKFGGARPKGGTRNQFVNLYSKEGHGEDVVLLKGRHPCNCMASKHAVINNCLHCGKIVCRQEGSGPCLFCGALVCTKDEQEILVRGSKKSEQLRRKLVNSVESGQTKAEAQRDRLLEFDRTSERRTKVIDDESDYFSVDSYKWMNEKQRKKLSELESGKYRRKDKSWTFDFAGRRIVEKEEESQLVKMSEEIEQICQELPDAGGRISNPDLNVPHLKIVNDAAAFDSSSLVSDGNNVPSSKATHRLQGAELQEMSDRGMCLSMHQPYASLLVQGIKVHEGRTWYSHHRGRLWIHAASRQPSDQEVEDLRKFYCPEWKSSVRFPTQFPVSCLLGSVDVVDMLPQEEYRERFPNGESGSRYVFVCTNPQELALKFPMSGQHKIYKLNKDLHRSVVKSPKKVIAGNVLL